MLDGLETPVAESDTVVILPAMAGGSSYGVPPVRLTKLAQEGFGVPAALSRPVW